MHTDVLVLSADDVRALLPVRDCIPVMREALGSLARGEVHQPLRSVTRPAGAAGFLGLMPSYRGGATPYYGLKAVCVFPENPKRGLDTHLGGVMLFDGETGELLLLANASAITEIRTAAASAVATELLARPGSRRVAIIGTGVQARSHLEAMRAILPAAEIVVAGRTAERAAQFAEAHGTGVARSIAEAVEGADVVITVTNAKDPILLDGMIGPGTHINLVGSSVRTAREADAALVGRGSLWCDRRESLMNESGDYLGALAAGTASEASIAGEIGELILSGRSGRRDDAEVTIFKSLGLGIEDLAAAAALYRLAGEQARGVVAPFEPSS